MDNILVVLNVVMLTVLVGFVFFDIRRRKGGESSELKEFRRELNERLKENRESVERTSKQMLDFTRGITKMDEALKRMDESLQGVSSFQQIFRTPKLRGRWGELALEHILAQYFPQDMFELQYMFKSGEAVDAILKLPDGKFLPIDAKFPHDHFERMTTLENESEREAAKKLFATEVKREIDSVAQKYILPSEGTENVAIIYIPAEAVYFEIINSIPEVNEYAQSKKILLASPNTFYLMLQVIQRWARDMQIGKQTQDFVKKLHRIVIDAGKLEESFTKLGKHMGNARSSFEDSEKRLEFLKERTEKLIELENEELEQIEAVTSTDE